MLAVPLHTAFKNGCLMRILGNAWMSFLSWLTNSWLVMRVSSSTDECVVGVMEWWRDGVIQYSSTPTLHHSSLSLSLEPADVVFPAAHREALIGVVDFQLGRR